MVVWVTLAGVTINYMEDNPDLFAKNHLFPPLDGGVLVLQLKLDHLHQCQSQVLLQSWPPSHHPPRHLVFSEQSIDSGQLWDSGTAGGE